MYNKKPKISIDGNALMSSKKYSSYQWYNDNGIIQGANSNQYIIDKSGIYYLEANNENGCSAMSEGIDLIYTNTDFITASRIKLIIFPNPNDGRFRLRFENGKSGEYHVQVINELGQVQLEKEVFIPRNNYIEEVDISHLPSGNYYIRVSDGESVNTQKIIVQ